MPGGRETEHSATSVIVKRARRLVATSIASAQRPSRLCDEKLFTFEFSNVSLNSEFIMFEGLLGPNPHSVGR